MGRAVSHPHSIEVSAANGCVTLRGPILISERRSLVSCVERVPGVGQVRIFGARDYSMRIWLNPARMARVGVTASDIASVIREQRPRVVILPYWKGRHPDHYTCSVVGYEACFLAGLTKLADSAETKRAGMDKQFASLKPHRPFKIVYATLYYDIRPTFVVDISDQFETRFEALMAYKSQFSDQEAGNDIFPARDEIHARIEAMARFYGMLAGVTYAEPFLQNEVGLVDDLTAIPVKSI